MVQVGIKQPFLLPENPNTTHPNPGYGMAIAEGIVAVSVSGGNASNPWGDGSVHIFSLLDGEAEVWRETSESMAQQIICHFSEVLSQSIKM